MKRPAGGGLRTKRRLGGLLGSPFKRELRGIIFFPRLFEGDVGQVEPLLNAKRLSILLLSIAEEEFRRAWFTGLSPDLYLSFCRHLLLYSNQPWGTDSQKLRLPP